MLKSKLVTALVLALLAVPAFPIYVEEPDYLPVPEAAQPLEGLLPQKGVESSAGRGYLQVNSQHLKRKHNVNFETREVEVVSYLALPPVAAGGDGAPDAGALRAEAGPADSTALWQAHYSELNTYSMDMRELAWRRLWLNEFIGKEDPSSGAGPGLLDIVIPVNVPDWMKRIGVDKPRLRINGSYKLVVEGTQRQGTGTQDQGDSWFPDLHMDQQPAFSVKGSIGRLINIEINSEEGFGTNLKEQLKITYKGEGDELEDDIIQEIEAGNTSLALTGTSLTGYTETHKGLFGLKMRMRFGGLEVTTIASQEGGSQERQKLGLGTAVSEFTIEDRAMDLHRHFFLTPRDREEYRDPAKWNGSSPAYFHGGEGRRPVEAYTLLLTGQEPDFRDTATACAYDIAGANVGPCETGRWKLLKEGEYVYDERLRMLTVPGGHRNMSIAARWQGDPVPSLPGGGRDRSQLVLIHSRISVGLPQLDSLMWRNVYNIGKVAAQDRANFRIRLVDKDSAERGITPADTITYARRLGLERPDAKGQLLVDNPAIFNFDQGYMVLPCQGGISLEDDRANCLTPMKRVNPATNIYTAPVDELQNGSTTHRFVLTGRQRKSTFDVRETSHSVSGSQCLDITPGTEKLVRNGSETLVRNQDYEVLYETGQITLISPRARDPNASIDVSYECTPPFQIQDKILLGTRLEYKLDAISEESMLGATLLYKSQTTTQERPDLGREPFNQFLWGFNARLAGAPKWMTRLANLAPFVETEAPSRANFEFEVAQSRYNPNTKESAYLDNFEGTENVLPMPMFIYQWFKASPPEFDFAGRADETLDYRHQGNFMWHSSIKEAYARIYGSTGNTYTNSREQTLLKLSLQANDNLEGRSWGGVMRSLSQGLFNQSRKRTLEVVVNGREGDLNVDLGQISEDISILSVNAAKPDGRLQSEIDISRGEVLNSNDKYGLDGLTGTAERAVRWECKPTCYAVTVDTASNVDPGSDNYCEPKGFTEEPACVNGTEGSNKGSFGYGYDTEDLDRSGTLDVRNTYLRYVMHLDSACNARFHCEELRNGWRKYQIPLYGTAGKIGATAAESEAQILAQSKMMRVWLGRLPSRVGAAEALIARINLVGNTWEEGERNRDFEIDADRFASGDLRDSLAVRVPPSVLDSNRLKVDVINKQEEKLYRQSPNTKAEIDTRTDEPLPERSLVLRYENLHPGEAVHATRLLGSDAKDLTLYDRLRMEVHPDSNWVRTNAAAAGQNRVTFGLRLGKDRGDRDSRDYYEIRLPMETPETLDPRHADLWLRNSFNVRLDDLIGLKATAAYLAFGGRTVSKRAWHEGRGDSSLVLSVTGNPTLSRIDWMRMVIYVDSAATEPQRGELWINDLRLEGVDKSVGSSVRTQLQLDFSDFASVSGNLTYRNGGFTTMSETKATPASSKSAVDYNTALSLHANKFFPDQWGVSLPVSFQHQGSIQRPFTRPTSDLSLTGTDFMDFLRDAWNEELTSRGGRQDTVNRLARAFQSTRFEDKFSVFYKKEHRSESFLNQALFERPDIQYAFNSSHRDDPLTRIKTRNYTTQVKYSMSPFSNPSYKPLRMTEKWAYMPKFLSDMDLTPFPEKLNWTLADLTYARENTINKPRGDFDVPLNNPTDYNVTLTHGMDLEWRLLSFFGFGYRIATDREFDPERQCFDGGTFFDVGGEEQDCYGFLAHGIVFSFDDAGIRPGQVDPSTGEVVGEHRGQYYGILARERNRNQSFHIDLNPNLADFLTVGANYNSNYNHTRKDSTLDKFQTVTLPEHFAANADHDIKLNASLSLPALLGNDGQGALGSIKKKLDDWKLRNLDGSYSVSHKYNNEAFTYDFLERGGVDYGDLTAYQLGFVYDGVGDFFRNLFTGEPDPNYFDYLSPRDDRLGESLFGHEVGRSWDAGSGVTVPWLDLGLSFNLKYSKQYTLSRRFIHVDTSVVWPEYTVSGTFNDFAPRVAFLRKSFRSMTATTTYNFREEDRFNLFSNGREIHKVSQKFDPLVRISATTNKDVRGELSVKLGRDLTTNYDRKVQRDSASFKVPGGGGRDTVLPAFYRTDSARTPEEAFNVGTEGSISWDLETQKGLQFWRYYVKLQNNLRLKLSSEVTYNFTERRPFEDDPRREPDILMAKVKPEVSYNFTNNVDALFYLQYKYEKFWHTAENESIHEMLIHGEFTMRF